MAGIEFKTMYLLLTVRGSRRRVVMADFRCFWMLALLPAFSYFNFLAKGHSMGRCFGMLAAASAAGFLLLQFTRKGTFNGKLQMRTKAKSTSKQK
jgi:hypothetical protein